MTKFKRTFAASCSFLFCSGGSHFIRSTYLDHIFCGALALYATTVNLKSNHQDMIEVQVLIRSISKMAVKPIWIETESLHFIHILTVWFQIHWRWCTKLQILYHCLNAYRPKHINESINRWSVTSSWWSGVQTCVVPGVVLFCPW